MPDAYRCQLYRHGAAQAADPDDAYAGPFQPLLASQADLFKDYLPGIVLQLFVRESLYVESRQTPSTRIWFKRTL
jgi:hypothetical protein